MPEKTMREQSARFDELMQKIDRLYETYARASGMTYMSMAVLDLIFEYADGCTQKKICEETHYPKQSVNLIVKSFWQDGLVRLEELPEDRRNKRIVLTDRGHAYAEKAVGTLRRIDESAAEKLDAQQREQLLSLLRVYVDAHEQGIREALEGK